MKSVRRISGLFLKEEKKNSCFYLVVIWICIISSVSTFKYVLMSAEEKTITKKKLSSMLLLLSWLSSLLGMLISQRNRFGFLFWKIDFISNQKPIWSVFCQHIGAFISCLKIKDHCRLFNGFLRLNNGKSASHTLSNELSIYQIATISRSFQINHMQIKINVWNK